MTQHELKSLSEGDIVRGRTGHIWIVTENYGGRVTAVRTADLTNPTEWSIVQKARELPTALQQNAAPDCPQPVSAERSTPAGNR